MDYQKMWFELKEYIVSKNSHGKNELINKMTDIEIKANEITLEHYSFKRKGE